ILPGGGSLWFCQPSNHLFVGGIFGGAGGFSSRDLTTWRIFDFAAAIKSTASPETIIAPSMVNASFSSFLMSIYTPCLHDPFHTHADEVVHAPSYTHGVAVYHPPFHIHTPPEVASSSQTAYKRYVSPSSDPHSVM